jgi:hypothetical protein
MNKYFIERYYPLVLAVLVTIIFLLYNKRIENVDEVMKKIMDAALAICGALLGFLLTILTIINTINTRRMRFVKETGLFPLLNHYLRIALFLNITTITVYFLVPIFLSFDSILKNKDWVYDFLVFLISFTWIANIRFSSVFIRLLTDPNENSTGAI